MNPKMWLIFYSLAFLSLVATVPLLLHDPNLGQVCGHTFRNGHLVSTEHATHYDRQRHAYICE